MRSFAADLDFWTDGMATTVGLGEILDNHKLQKQDLIGECPRKIRNKIALKLMDWKVFGHILLIPKETLVSIDADNHTEEQKRIALLDSWHQREGEDATHFKLAEKLYEHNRRDLVNHLCELIVAGFLSTDSRIALDTQVNSAGMV